MDCPACGNTLTNLSLNGVSVDACQGGCGGIWFDKHEIDAFDEPAEGADPLVRIRHDPAVVVDGARRSCPSCRDIVMQRHYFCHRFEVEVDECPSCGGLWLDHGELEDIRSQFESAADREADRQAFLSGGMAPHLSDMRAAYRDEEARAGRIASVFRWLCPSAWVPGRQGWGAH